MTFPQDAAVAEVKAFVDAAPADIGKAELCAKLQVLPYAARVRAVSAWASRHRADPAAAALIKTITTDVPSEQPIEIAVESDVLELFPCALSLAHALAFRLPLLMRGR